MEGQTSSSAETKQALDLVHPLYLDVPMMVSFLAALEGEGVAFEGEETATTARSATKGKEGGGGIRIPAVASLLGLDLTGRASKEEGQQQTRETTVLRRHTEASLFNLLRHRLREEGRIHVVSAETDLAALRPESIIEMSGNYAGNALRELLALFIQILPYVGLTEEELRNPKPKARKNPKQSGNPAVRAGAEEKDDEPTQEEMFRMLLTMRDDLINAPVQDVVLDGPGDIRAVLTFSTEFFSDAVAQQMVNSRLTVLGKVSRVLAENDNINLTRRTALGAAGPDVSRQLVSDMKQDTQLFVEVSDPIVEPPALQILPMAVFL